MDSSARKGKILIVEPESELLELLVTAIARRFDAHITCVDSAGSCLDIEMSDPHDIVVAELRLPGFDGLRLAEQLTSLTTMSRPIVLMADMPNARELLRAMRAGVRDVFPKPFRVERLLQRVGELLAEYDVRRRHHIRYHRMRDLVRRVIRERRELDRRTELICRDLVGAHRRLVHRVLEFESHARAEN